MPLHSLSFPASCAAADLFRCIARLWLVCIAAKNLTTLNAQQFVSSVLDRTALHACCLCVSVRCLLYASLDNLFVACGILRVFDDKREIRLNQFICLLVAFIHPFKHAQHTEKQLRFTFTFMVKIDIIGSWFEIQAHCISNSEPLG